MKVTKEHLKKMGACVDGIDWFCKKFPEGASVEEAVTAAVEDGKFNYANWFLTQTFDKKQRIQYAVFAAEQVLDLFEKKYPSDARPRNAILAAKKCLKENNNAADAADAAYAAEHAAYAAEHADASAAEHAAYAAEHAAYAAEHAAYAAEHAAYAAEHADASAARKKIQKKIIEQGLNILKDKGVVA